MTRVISWRIIRKAKLLVSRVYKFIYVCHMLYRLFFAVSVSRGVGGRVMERRVMWLVWVWCVLFIALVAGPC